MAVFSPTNAKVHFKAYDGNFTDALGNTAITQNNGVAMATAQKLFGQQAMFMANFSDSITFNTPSVFDVGTGDYTVGFWFHPTQLTSYDRLFATGPDSGGNPFRIYNHNGSIGVYVENDDEVPGDALHDLIINYYLGAGAANQWWHIMVQRNSGTTKLYINGTEQGSSTVSYEINNSSSPTLGADINAAATGVKGYIQDFFWTEEAVSFSQADFDPSTPEPVTFHNGNPSISSFSSSANSVENSGDTVTLSWSVSGETKLELLKYVSGLLNSTEDVLGLSSKSVTITETVSYKIRATNDNSVVDSSLVEITLNGGNNMSRFLAGNDAIPVQLHAKMLGGLVTGSDSRYIAMPVMSQSAGTHNPTDADFREGKALHADFNFVSGSIIQAMNFLHGTGFTQSNVGEGLDETAFANTDVLNVKLDGSTLEVSSDGVKVKAAGITKTELNSDVAGSGISGGAGTALALDLNELGAAAVNVAADSIAIIDADDNSSKKESVADLVAGVAGTGLSAASGQLSFDVSTSHTITGTYKFEKDKLQIKGSDYEGNDNVYFGLKVVGGMLVVTEQ